ncbi:hypothetical protein Tco_0321233 [Tanacetum coccineum]
MNKLHHIILANPSSCPQLDHEDLETMELKITGEEDALEILETRWGPETVQKEDSKALVTIDGEDQTQSDDKHRIKAYLTGFKKVKIDVLAYHKKCIAEAQKEKEDLKAKVEKWHNSSKNLSKLLNTQMSANDKFGLGYGDHRYDGILSYENEVLQSVFMNKESDIENQPVYDRFAEGMHVVPPPMTGNYMPSGPEIEIDYSQFTYGPKQTQPSESESQSSESDTCESNISTEPSELVSEPVVNDSNVECQPKVWSDAPIIEEYESDSEDECVSIPTKQQEIPSFANQQIVIFKERHGQREIRQTWNNVQRVNKQNQFVPSAVLTRTGKIPVNTARASGTKNVSTARQSFNRQAVLTSTAMKVNTVKPIVNRVRPANVFHKTHSPSSRPFKKTTVLSTNFSKQKVNTAKVKVVSTVEGKRETAVKPSAGCNWRPQRYNWHNDYPHRALKNKGIVDSGCSRHMTGNKAYLAEFQDFNGGPVAFGGSKGYITGKGKIKTGPLKFVRPCAVAHPAHPQRRPWSMIGSLMYLTASRPDIMFAVCACSRFKVTPKSSHLSDVKRIFRRKSTTGGCQFLGRRLISWQCKKQTIVATSTTEAEYVAAASCCGQVLWIQNQMLDYGFNFMNTKIYIDNESTICIVKNPVYHSKTKHIAIRHHFIRDAYEKKLIQVLKIHTDDNVADLLTKAFDVSRGLIEFRGSLRRVTDGTEALLIPTLFILWLDKVSTVCAKLVPLGKVCTAIKTLKKNTAKALISLFTTISLSSTMAVLDSCPKHNMVAYLEKTEGNAEFHEIIDFLKRSLIHHALTVRSALSLKTSPTTTIPGSIQEVLVSDQAKEIQLLKAQITKLKKKLNLPLVSTDGIQTYLMNNFKGTEEHIEGNDEHKNCKVMMDKEKSVRDVTRSLCSLKVMRDYERRKIQEEVEEEEDKNTDIVIDQNGWNEKGVIPLRVKWSRKEEVKEDVQGGNANENDELEITDLSIKLQIRKKKWIMRILERILLILIKEWKLECPWKLNFASDDHRLFQDEIPEGLTDVLWADSLESEEDSTMALELSGLPRRYLQELEPDG